jgi:histidinol-phosphate phosphatase family protein
MTAAIFLDKDGTLVENDPMNVDPERIRLMPEAGLALSRLAGAGFRIAVVSNQPGVALGRFAEAALAPVHDRLAVLLAAWNVRLDGFHYCPHHPQGTVAEYRRECECRKPAPGLVTSAAAALDADLGRCWMIGDILDDVEAAHRAGCRAILYDSGGETEWKRSPLRAPEFMARRFSTIADFILARADSHR